MAINSRSRQFIYICLKITPQANVQNIKQMFFSVISVFVFFLFLVKVTLKYSDEVTITNHWTSYEQTHFMTNIKVWNKSTDLLALITDRKSCNINMINDLRLGWEIIVTCMHSLLIKIFLVFLSNHNKCFSYISSL